MLTSGIESLYNYSSILIDVSYEKY